MGLSEKLDALTASKSGFTIIEMVVAIVILSVGVLGIAASTGSLMQAAGQISRKAEALQAAESRISVIQMDPRYLLLDSIYGGTESSLPGLDGYSRVTRVARTEASGEAGRMVDYTRITVSVSATGMVTITRSIIMGAP